jgi:hypothetical protein
MSLNRLVSFSMMALALGATLKLSHAIEDCDYERASAATGACATNLATCEAQDTQLKCVNPYYTRYLIKQDFPTHCKANLDKNGKEIPTNCNMPSKPCYGPVTCTWTGAGCTNHTSPWNWVSAPKRTTGDCALEEPNF